MAEYNQSAAPSLGAADSLYRDSRHVLYIHLMPRRSPICPGIVRGMYGTHVLDHLAADGAGFPGGQVAVVAVLQIHADLPWCPFYILNSPNTGTVEGI